MNSWHDDLLNLVVTPTPSPESLFFSIEQIAQKLGFKYVAYGYQAPYPVTQPKITLLNNYPVSWRRHYKKAGYLNTDPIVMHAKRSQNPLLWVMKFLQKIQNFGKMPKSMASGLAGRNLV